MDFVSQSHTIGERIEDVKPKGYDHCYVLNKDGPTLSVDIQGQAREKLTLAATVIDRDSCRKVSERYKVMLFTTSNVLLLLRWKYGPINQEFSCTPVTS